MADPSPQSDLVALFFKEVLTKTNCAKITSFSSFFRRVKTKTRSLVDVIRRYDDRITSHDCHKRGRVTL